MSLPRFRFAVAALALTPALAACVTVNAPAASDSSSSSTPTEAAAGTSTTDSETAPGTSNDVTPNGSNDVTPNGSPRDVRPTPGQVLPPRTPAVLTYRFAGKTTDIRVTPVSVVRGSVSDFTGVTLPPEVRGATPYYVTATYQNAGTATMSYPQPQSTLDAGSDAKKFPTGFTGRVPQCPTNTAATFGPGDSLTTCRIFFAPAGEAVTKLRWRMAGSNDDIVYWNVA